MRDERLKPCPFCGGEATIHKSNFGYGVMCKIPFCCYLTSTHDTKKEAIKTWNTRKPMERIVERLEDTKGVAFLTLANTGDTMKDIVYDEVAAYLNTAIEIVKGGGVDETD